MMRTDPWVHKLCVQFKLLICNNNGLYVKSLLTIACTDAGDSV
jgi:hypothetical protein